MTDNEIDEFILNKKIVSSEEITLFDNLKFTLLICEDGEKIP